MAAFALQRLFHLTGEVRYRHAAERTLQLFYRQMANSATGFSTLLMALEEALQPTRLVIVRGAAADLAPWRDALRRCHLPQSVTLFIPHGTPGLPPALAKPEAAHVNAWVCEGVSCLPPIDALPDLLATLKPGKVAGAKTD